MIRTKSLLLIASILVLLFHFTMTVIYNFSDHSRFANNYIEPLFKQDWRFFAPDPSTESRSLHVKFKTKKNSDWSNWISPTRLSKNEFDYNRFSYHGKLVHLNAALCHFIVQDVKANRAQFENTGSYFLAKEYLKSWVKWQYGESPRELWFAVVVKNTDSQESTILMYQSVAY